MVAQCRLKERIHRGANGIQAARPRHLERPGNARHLGAPVTQQTLVGNDRARQIACGRLGLQHVAQPYPCGLIGRQAIAPGQRSDHIDRLPHHQHDKRRHRFLRQPLPPHRHQPAHARVLDAGQRRAAEVTLQDGMQRCAGRLHLGHALPASGQRQRVVPLRSKRSKDVVVLLPDVGVLEKALGIVFRRRDQPLAEIHAQMRQGTGDRRGAAAVHAKHDEHAPRGRHRYCIHAAQSPLRCLWRGKANIIVDRPQAAHFRTPLASCPPGAGSTPMPWRGRGAGRSAAPVDAA